MIKKIIHFFLGLLTVVIILIICKILFNISGFDFSDNSLGITAGLSFAFVFFFKSHKIYFMTTIILSVLLLSSNLYKNYTINKYAKGHTVTWASKKQTTTVPFHVINNLIFIKTKINNRFKYVMFDTGAEMSLFKNIYNNKTTLKEARITDANGITKTNKIKELNSLSIGNLQFQKVKNISLDTAVTNKKGWMSKDFVAGILGCNLINSFVWDINLKKKTIQITEAIFNENNQEAVAIPLIQFKNRWKIRVTVNGETKKAMLDSGSSIILTLKDSLHLPENYKYPIKQYAKSSTLYSSKNNNKERVVFADVNIGNLIFKEIALTDSKKNNVIGNPLFWEYERVVLDFIGKKMYLFQKNKSKKVRSITNITNRLKRELTKTDRD